jgi:uncharacterized protein (UPF0264 family)
MHLLVSIACASEVSSVIAGGADVIDAKNPASGALGAVTIEHLRDIHSAVAGRRPLSAALGDASSEIAIERAARSYAAAGAAFVKIGFAGISRPAKIAALIAAATRGARDGSGDTAGVVAVAYADTEESRPLSLSSFVDVAASAGAVGVLLDTSDKRGPGLRALVPHHTLADFVREGQQRGLFVAVAGKLTADDLPFVLDTGADIAGVRGAACVGGRDGCITAEKVRHLRALCGPRMVRLSGSRSIDFVPQH